VTGPATARLRRHHRRALLVVDLVLVVAAVAALLVVRPQPSLAQTAFTIHKVDEASFTPQTRTDPFFVLLIGNDGRAGLDGIRGDALHVLGINPAAHSAVILNIPRDTYVQIPGLGQAKINDAYKQAGFAKQVETVSTFTGIPFSFVVETNFDGFQALVDEMGGVDVDVPYKMFDTYSGADFPAGRVHMQGPGALSFARNRHIPNGDIARTEHQGLLLIGALQKAREVATTPVSKLRLLGMMARHTRYDGVGFRDLYTLLDLGLSIDPANVRNVTMPAGIGKVGKADVVFAAGGSAELFADVRDDAILQSH
jgi:LCP family protein required for cell wall assembly